MPWKCFIVERTKEAALILRRYRGKGPGQECSMSGTGYHNANIDAGDVPFDRSDIDGDDMPLAHSDIRWPSKCACGYVFQENDVWQANREVLYRGERDGVEIVAHSHLYFPRTLPPGAMFIEEPDVGMGKFFRARPGPDGKIISVILPGQNLWCIDGPTSRDEYPWTRTGTPPVITAAPSINFNGSYHGHVQNGFVTEDCEGRRFDEAGRLCK